MLRDLLPSETLGEQWVCGSPLVKGYKPLQMHLWERYELTFWGAKPMQYIDQHALKPFSADSL